MVAYADYIKGWWISWLAREMGAIPIRSSRKSMVQAIRTAREALRDGDLVCIFPEGQLTRTGYLQQFRPGFLSILKDTDVPLDSGLSGRAVGEHFQLRAREVLLEMAAPVAVSDFDRVRQTDAQANRPGGGPPGGRTTGSQCDEAGRRLSDGPRAGDSCELAAEASGGPRRPIRPARS